ncbi:MAG TPA: glycosyltransferase [Thermoanaerobaculia bacterium]|nr:glycosyltransferase [Thermoanaerobaculia bacterium]
MKGRARARVLHCIPSMAGGGAEKQLALLATALPAHGWDVDVAILDRGVHLDRLERSGARLHFIPSSSNYDPLIPLRLGRIMRRVKPDVVQTWLAQMDVAAGLAALTRRVPWIVSERSTQALPPSLKRRVRETVIGRATAVISNSEEGLRSWQSRHPSKPHFYVPNAVALSEIDATPAADLSRFRLTPQTRLVLAASRLVLPKNLETFRTAMQFVVREVDAVALICGIGPQREVLLERIARDEQTGRVVLPGFVDDMAGWLKAADVMVSVSLFEGRPNAVMEAMACRTPIVVSNIAEHREILDETTASFVDPHDAHDIAQAIIQTLRDSDAARKRAELARRTVDVWTPDAIAAEYARIYRTLMKKN